MRGLFIVCIGTHEHGRQAMSLFFVKVTSLTAYSEIFGSLFKDKKSMVSKKWIHFMFKGRIEKSPLGSPFVILCDLGASTFLLCHESLNY